MAHHADPYDLSEDAIDGRACWRCGSTSGLQAVTVACTDSLSRDLTACAQHAAIKPQRGRCGPVVPSDAGRLR